MVRNSPNTHAGDFPYEIRKGNDGNQYGSAPDKNGVFKWKKYDTFIDNNAIKKYKFWTPKNKMDKEIKYDEKEIFKTINSLKKELKKYNIILLYIDDVSDWGNPNGYHMIDNLWYTADKILEKEYKIKDPLDTQSYLMTA